MKNLIKNFGIIIILLTVCCLSFVSSAFAAVDPATLGVGARPLGMGKAYVAFAQDAETVFLNPAGLGAMSGPKFTSMYANLMGDARYAVIGGAYPTPYGVVGGGFVSSGVSDILLYDSSAIPQGDATYGHNVAFISYGFELSQLMNLGIISDFLLAKLPIEAPILAKYGEEIFFGGSLKYFSQGGTNIDPEGTGTGIDMDLGVLYRPNGWLSFGLMFQNCLPLSWGGKMTYNEGIEESIPAVTKLGFDMKILGENGVIKQGGDLDVVVDFDMHHDQKINGTAHVGAEYWVPMPEEFLGAKLPKKILALRAGLDQDAGPDGVINNLTAGIGLRYQGVQFDYAYHPYSEIPENTTHYFSISYVGPEKEKEAEVAEEPAEVVGLPLMELLSPNDKLITRDKSIKVVGTVSNAGTTVDINSEAVKIDQNKEFSTDILLKPEGKHLIVVKATGDNGESMRASRRIIKLMTFSDVLPDYWAVDSIEQSGTVGLVEGYPDGTFKPERSLSRAELATLVVRAKSMPLPSTVKQIFSDVPKTHWAAPYIQVAANEGWVKGYPDGTFKANNKISMVEGLVVMARLNGAKEKLDEKLVEAPYKDMPTSHWACDLVSQAKEMGIARCVKGDYLKPNKELMRSEAVDIMYLTSFAKAIVAELFDWEVGFKEKKIETREAFEIELIEFADVKEDYWAKKPIQYLATAGIISGFPDGTFKPNRNLTRAEVSALLVRASGVTIPAVHRALFSDLPKSNWAAPYVKAAMDLGLVTGYPDGTFKPNQSLNRAEAVALIARFDKLTVLDTVSYKPYKDMAAKHWATKYVVAAKDAGILSYLGEGSFEPNKLLTRAEAAEMVSRTSIGVQKIEELKQLKIKSMEEDYKKTKTMEDEEENTEDLTSSKAKELVSFKTQVQKANSLEQDGFYLEALEQYKSALSYLVYVQGIPKEALNLERADRFEQDKNYEMAIKEYKLAIRDIVYSKDGVAVK